MLKEYANEIKNYNMLEKLEKGCYVDAKEENRWQVAQVKDIQKTGLKTFVELRFDGYG